MNQFNNLNNIKLIITDLDKTLLRNDKTISNYAIDILTKIQQLGIKVVFATARSEKSCERFLSSFKPNALISNGGALAREGNSTIYSAMLSKEIANVLIDLCSKTPDVRYITAEAEDGYFVNHPTDNNDLGWLDYKHGIQFDFKSNTFNKNIYKLGVEILNEHTAQKISDAFPQVGFLAFSGEKWYRFAHKSATKWAAIKPLASHLDININDIVFFGDDYNDIDALQNCGTGVAVENAINEAKSVSDYICSSNNEDGVAKWIENNIL